MYAFIALFFPAVIMLGTMKYVFRKEMQENARLIGLCYIINVLWINSACLFILTLLNGKISKFVSKLNSNGVFALKYTVLAVFFALVTPWLIRYIKEKVSLSFRVPEWKEVTFPKINWYILIWILALVLFSLNMIRVFDSNFWADEAYSISLAKMDFSSMIAKTAYEAHPPLYYIFLQAGYHLFGESGILFHVISLIPYALLLLFSMTVIWKRFGKEAAVMMVAFSSLLEMAVTYNVEVRMYSWAAFFVLLSYYELFCILKDNKIRNYIGFSVFSLAAAYTHYFALIAVAFFYVTLLVWMFLDLKKYLKKVLLVCLTAVIVYLPWLMALIKTFSIVSKGFWIPGIPTLEQCRDYIFAGPYQEQLFEILIVSVVICIIVETNVIHVHRQENKKVKVDIDLYKIPEVKNNGMILWLLSGFLCFFGTSLVGIWISRLTTPIFILRYLYPLVPVLWLVLSVSLSKIRGKSIWCLLVLVLVVKGSFPKYVETYNIEADKNYVLEQTMQMIDESMDQDDIILTDAVSFTWTILECYYPGVESRLISLEESLDIEEGKDYWLMIIGGEDACLKTEKFLKRQGCEYTLVCPNGVIGDAWVCVYKLRL